MSSKWKVLLIEENKFFKSAFKKIGDEIEIEIVLE